MLWVDTTPNASLAAKIENGAAYFEQRRGRRPTRVTVHPSTILAAGGYPDVPGILVRTSRTVEPSYFEFNFGAPEPEPTQPSPKAA